MIQKINSDRELIIKSLNREFKDKHPSVYLYVYGHPRTKKTAILNVLKYTRIIFNGCFDDDYVKPYIIEFLEYKKEQYYNGEIKVKRFYFNMEKALV